MGQEQEGLELAGLRAAMMGTEEERGWEGQEDRVQSIGELKSWTNKVATKLLLRERV